jgi:hypothetical protein
MMITSWPGVVAALAAACLADSRPDVDGTADSRAAGGGRSHLSRATGGETSHLSRAAEGVGLGGSAARYGVGRVCCAVETCVEVALLSVR